MYLNAFKYILDNCVLPTLCSQCGGCPFSVPALLCRCVQTQLHKDMIWGVWCGGTWVTYAGSWPAFYWTPLEGVGKPIVSQVFSCKISTWPHKCFWLSGHKLPDTPKSCRNSSEKSGGCYIAIRNGRTLHMNTHGFRMGCSTRSYTGRCEGQVSTNIWLYSARQKKCTNIT